MASHPVASVKQRRLAYTDIVRLVGTTLISMGAGLLVFVVMTIGWGDPFSRLSESRTQDTLERAYSKASGDFGSDAQALNPEATLDPRRTRSLARRWRASLDKSEVAGRIRIADIGLRKYVVNGTGTAELQKGPGLYPEGGFPGSGRPVAIAGHRTTFGAPFLHIDQLKPGDPIVVDMPYARFTYIVSRTRIIQPDDWSILVPGSALKTARARNAVATTGKCPRGTCEHLVLTACHPKHSAAQRIAVFAELQSVALREQAV